MVHDLIQWVGTCYYSLDSFIEEAKNLGCCRRISQVPDIVPGMSRMFLIHDQETRKCTCGWVGSIDESKKHPKTYLTDKHKLSPAAVVFGFFIIKGVEVVVKDFSEFELLKQRFKNRQDVDLIFTPVLLKDALLEPVRRCGYRKEGFYVVSISMKNYDFLVELVKNVYKDQVELAGTFFKFKFPITWNGKHFRGYRYFDSTTIDVPNIDESIYKTLDLL